MTLNFQNYSFLACKVKNNAFNNWDPIELEIIETVKSCAYGDAIVLDTAYVALIRQCFHSNCLM